MDIINRLWRYGDGVDWDVLEPVVILPRSITQAQYGGATDRRRRGQLHVRTHGMVARTTNDWA